MIPIRSRRFEKNMNTITMIALAVLCIVPTAGVLLSLSRLARTVDDAERGEPLR